MDGTSKHVLVNVKCMDIMFKIKKNTFELSHATMDASSYFEKSVSILSKICTPYKTKIVPLAHTSAFHIK